MVDRNFVSINGTEIFEYDDYHPQQFDITKGGRNPLTGYNRMRIIAKKWKLVISAAFISDAEFKKIVDLMPNTLQVAVVFRDKDDGSGSLVSFTGYAVVDKSRTPESDAMGCWSNFSLELIEN